MTNLFKKTLSPLALKTYKFLYSGGSKTAKELSEMLGISVNQTYRPMKELVSLNMVIQKNTYPKTFEALPASEVLHMYNLIIKQNFIDTFGQTKRNNNLAVSFIHSREQMLLTSLKDVKTAKHGIDLIVSGHEVPAKLVLAQKQAVDRGVRVRLLIQNKSKKSLNYYYSFKTMGKLVRYFPYMEARVFIIDNKIVYFGSYDSKNYKQSIGTRFDYAPYAKIISEIFEQRWHAAEEI